jgi:hypothetical protein
MMIDDNSEIRYVYLAISEFFDKLVVWTKHFPAAEHYGVSGLANDLVNTCTLVSSHLISVSNIKDEYHRAKFLKLPLMHSMRIKKTLQKSRLYLPKEIYEELLDDLNNIQSALGRLVLE